MPELFHSDKWYCVVTKHLGKMEVVAFVPSREEHYDYRKPV